MMLKIANGIATGLLGLLVGCSAVIETNEQACIRANTKLLACLLEGSGADSQDFVDELQQAVLVLCAGLPDAEDCNWRPVAQCISGAACEDIAGAGAGFGAICDEAASSILGCPMVMNPCLGNPCDDGMACNGLETCSPNGVGVICADGVPVQCSDGRMCDEPIGVCLDEPPDRLLDSDGDGVPDIIDVCPETPDSEMANSMGCSCGQLDCNDGDPCTVDTCTSNGCQNSLLNCDDGDACTEDACEGGVCLNTATECPDDDLFCNGAESCVDGQCISPGNPCGANEVCSEGSDVCDATESVSDLTADAGADKAISLRGSVTLDGSASGGEDAYSYDWFPATGLDDASIATPTASPSKTTTYTLTVTDFGGDLSTDTVTVTVEVGMGCVSVENEPNDSLDAADAAEPICFSDEGVATITGFLSAQQDQVDYFSFVADAGDRISVSLQRDSGNLNASVALWDAANSTLTETTRGSYPRRFTDYVVNADGTYYVRLGAVCCVTSGSYTLVVTNAGNLGPFDEVEPNDTISDAQSLSVFDGIETIKGLLSDQRDQIDYYSIEADAGDRISVSVQSGSGDLDADVDFLDSDGSKIAEASSGQYPREFSNYVVSVTGAYYIRVAVDCCSSTGSYTLIVTSVANDGPYDDAEPNDSIAEAEQLSLFDGMVTITGLLSDQQDQIDFFSFEADAGDRISVRLDGSSGNLDASAELRDVAGLTLKETPRGGYPREFSNYVVTTEGKYYIRLAVNCCSSTGSYKLTVTNVGNDGPYDENEPNDTRFDANELSFFDGVATTAGLLSHQQDPIDYFSLQAEVGDRLSVSLDGSSGNLDAVAELLDRHGVVLMKTSRSGGYPRFFTEFVVESAGIHYIKLSVDCCESNGSYRMTVMLE